MSQTALTTAATPGLTPFNCTNNHRDSTVVAMEDLHLKLQAYEARIHELEEENAQLKLKQVEISQAKELYLKIFEDFPALIWRSRLDKLCDYFNRTWLEWTGKTLEQEFGNGWANGVHPDDFDQCLETYVKAFDKHEPFYMEYRLIDRHGEYRWIGDHGTPFFDLDNTTFLGYIGSCYDITENKRNEENLIKLNATKDKFFSIVAHDLRNPISAFVSISEMLMEEGDEAVFEPAELREIAAEMHKDSKNTLLLLENLLDWSKSQTDEIKFQPACLDLRQLCEEVVSQVELCAKAKKIDIGQQQISQPISIQADKNMITTVLRNLLMNAVKFTPSGGRINLKAEMETTGGTVLVTVSDTGVGLSNEQIENLFVLPGEKSKHTASTRGTDNEGGSGLGLVICRDFIEKHGEGSRIWAESEKGHGTEFKFIIPCVASSS